MFMAHVIAGERGGHLLVAGRAFGGGKLQLPHPLKNRRH
jgi:hypothetical protein